MIKPTIDNYFSACKHSLLKISRPCQSLFVGSIWSQKVESSRNYRGLTSPPKINIKWETQFSVKTKCIRKADFQLKTHFVWSIHHLYITESHSYALFVSPLKDKLIRFPHKWHVRFHSRGALGSWDRDPTRPDDPTFWPDPTCNFSLLRDRPDSEIATRPDPTDPTFWPDPSAPLMKRQNEP